MFWIVTPYEIWCACMLSRVQLFVTPWTVPHQAPLPMEFSRQQYWSRLPFPSSEDLPDPGIEPTSLLSSALAGEFFTSWATREAPSIWYIPSMWFANTFFHSIRCLFTAFSLSVSTPQTPGVAIPESARRGRIIARAELGGWEDLLGYVSPLISSLFKGAAKIIDSLLRNFNKLYLLWKLKGAIYMTDKCI